MSACETCVNRSALENEAFGFAEHYIQSPGAARKLMLLEDDLLLARLAERDPGIGDKVARRADAIHRGDVAQSSIWTTCRHNELFPKTLLELDQKPLVLYGVGNPQRIAAIQDTASVAIVGARRASSTGRETAYVLGRDLARAGVSVISGMALGIDGAAHRGALAATGTTIAVLAGGPERAYPRSHAKLYAEIAETGVVLSERPPRSRAMRWGFPARNRLIAALATVTIVVEATASSGSRHTTEFALDLHRDLGAVPGPVTSPLSDLPHDLIATGATLVRNANDVIDMLNRSCELPFGSPAPPGGVHEVVHSLICGRDATPHAILRELPNLAMRELMGVLGELELDGRIIRDHTGSYRPRVDGRVTG